MLRFIVEKLQVIALRQKMIFDADHEEGFHRQTGSVFSFHLLLQQNPRMPASGV